jgi:hypothetical protein
MAGKLSPGNFGLLQQNLNISRPDIDVVDCLFMTLRFCTAKTHQRHWLCIAAMVFMPGSTPIKVLV